MASIVSGIMCAFCYLFGVWVGSNKLKSNADQRTQRVESVESVESVEADTPQTEQWHYNEQDSTWYPYNHSEEERMDEIIKERLDKNRAEGSKQ